MKHAFKLLIFVGTVVSTLNVNGMEGFTLRQCPQSQHTEINAKINDYRDQIIEKEEVRNHLRGGSITPVQESNIVKAIGSIVRVQEQIIAKQEEYIETVSQWRRTHSDLPIQEMDRCKFARSFDVATIGLLEWTEQIAYAQEWLVRALDKRINDLLPRNERETVLFSKKLADVPSLLQKWLDYVNEEIEIRQN